MTFHGDLILADPANLVKCEEDWLLVLSEGYDRAALHLLGICAYLSAEIGVDTIRTVLDENGNPIGQFYTDSALVSICSLPQILVYHPGFLTKNEKYRDSFCIVRNFEGDVEVDYDKNGNLQIVGYGKNGFRTICGGGKNEN